MVRGADPAGLDYDQRMIVIIAIAYLLTPLAVLVVLGSPRFSLFTKRMAINVMGFQLCAQVAATATAAFRHHRMVPGVLLAAIGTATGAIVVVPRKRKG